MHRHLKVLSSIPFFRICIPFAAGILLALQFTDTSVNWLVLVLLLLSALSFLFLEQQSKFSKILFLICTDIFLLGLAVNLVNQTRVTNHSLYYGKFIKDDVPTKVMGVINGLPQHTGNFIKCELKVLEVKKGSAYIKANGTIIAYFRNSGAASQIKFGQTILVNAKLLEPEDPKNPLEFNYKNYLRNKQVQHMCFVDSISFSRIHSPSVISTIWAIGLTAKETVLARLKNSELTQEAYAICAALLTGYDNEIGRDVTEAFSHSGTLHVLSVSGLHTGLIYLVLAFMFGLIDRKKKYKLLQFIFITIFLWFFALLTGFSAPVLRAVIMFNLLGIGRLFFRNNYQNQINLLLVSAFILLCYDPFLITDIGFQLSYFAMFGILFFQPIFAAIWKPGNKVTEYIWQSISASFAATLTTLPFTLFYFKQFPLWFFVCNLVVVPLSFVVLLLAVLVVIKIAKTALLVNWLVAFLNWFIQLFNSSSGGYIDNIDFNLIDAMLMSAVIILISAAIYYRSYRYVLYVFLFIITWQINGLIDSYRAKDEKLFTVYQIKKQAVCSVKNKNFVIADSIKHEDYTYHVRPQLVSFNYPRLNYQKFNYVKTVDQTILLLNRRNFWPDINPRAVLTLVVSNGFKLKESDMETFTHLKLLVADGSNNSYEVKQLAKLCSKFGVEFYSTKEKGACILNL